MDKKRTVSFLMLFLAFILLSSGMSWAALSEVSLTSEPSGAEVYLDGKKIGNTPCTVPLEGMGKLHSLELKKEGCQSAVKKLMNGAHGFTSEWYPEIVYPDGTYDILEDATLHILLKHN